MRTERRLRAPRRRTFISGLVISGLLAVPTAIAIPAGADPIADKRAEAAQVADELEKLQTQLMDLSAQAERVGYELKLANDQVEEAQQRVDQTNAELEQRRGEMRTFAVQAYQQGDDSPELNALLTADADTAPAKKSYLSVATGNRQDLVDSLASAQRQAKDDTARLQQAQAESERKASEIDSTRSGVEANAAAQRQLNARIQGELQELVRQEQARREAEQRRIAEEAAARARAQEQARAAQAPASPAAAPRSTNPPSTGGGGGGGGRTTPAPAPGPAPAPAPEYAPAPSRGGLQGAIDAAVTRIGRGGYVWGASGPNNFDCSGLVMWAFNQVGISLPHYSGAQYNATTRISRAQLQPGDLVFWGPGGSDHVALYMGGNQIVHAFGSGGGVKITHLDGWWKPASGYGRLR